jgi:hypothetical protein
MKHSEQQNATLPAGHRIPPPSTELKDSVLRAARREWASGATKVVEISWVFPVLRLAASLAVAVGLVYAAGMPGAGPRRSVSRLRPSSSTVEVAGVRLNQGLVFGLAASPRPRRHAARVLLEHRRRTREMLDVGNGENG